MSNLQISWDFTSSLIIFVYFPLCILIGTVGTFSFNAKKVYQYCEDNNNQVWNKIFYLFAIIFVAQFYWFLPPALSGDPMNGRLTWGVKYVHVATEIIFRTSFLFCLGNVANRGKFRWPDVNIIFIFLAYAFLVVSRGLILEILIYIIFTLIIINSKKYGSRFKIKKSHVASLASLWFFFFIYGQWRQGDGFSITEYGEMKTDSSFLSWIFGYFLVNFDNLALIIMKNYKNNSLSNIFGPLLQTLQLANYDEIDDYLYVGRFNLGTGLRSFVLDYGAWLGGIAFSVVWTFWIAAVGFCSFEKHKFSVLLLIAYVGFCLPITGRLLEPPYLFPLIIILISDKLAWIKLKIKKSD